MKLKEFLRQHDLKLEISTDLACDYVASIQRLDFKKGSLLGSMKGRSPDINMAIQNLCDTITGCTKNDGADYLVFNAMDKEKRREFPVPISLEIP